ncbi:hypothetical protein [Allomesorhizobium alhagi]|uniref:Uncharacterized protein n=1 Tax=Mesorhizobium alhagi CCNWXJ12-2 TaxID=1107882 RepID=H0HQZ7_9HYPH|nr:hypothetical protein [Mesorhizobium alhagi]EHK56859.1 hypothetical protein MAXJ12_12897 [Mesorhizobium alhagi CCNWXJ12-2]
MDVTTEATLTDDAFEWAIVEIMGHRKLYGRIREEERFGAKMLRIDVPKPTAPRTLFDAAEGKPEEPPLTWVTQWYGGPAIFSLTLTDESTVLRANQPYAPAQRYIAPPDRHDDDDDEQVF